MCFTTACREQGFVNGLALQPNAYMTAALPPPDQRELLGRLTDAALVSLAGNLRSFELEDHAGRVVKGVLHPLLPRVWTHSGQESRAAPWCKRLIYAVNT